MRIAGFAAGLMAALVVPLGGASAFDVEERKLFEGAEGGPVLRIISTADLNVFEPIITRFQADRPDVSVDYTVTGTSDLMQAIYVEGAVFDLAISSAMDLQTKLANDGFVQRYRAPATADLPEWAVWRDQLFAFTQEPAVLVVSSAYFDPGEAPRNRDELIALLRADPDRFQGRVGTYDVRRSGFGYLMATQDSRNSDAFWRLMEVMGRLDAQLYCCSGDMIRDVASGKLALAYNVLGSYAASQQKTTGGFEIIEFTDYVNVMLRTVLIPANAENVTDARSMIDFLTAAERRPQNAQISGLPAVDADVTQANSAMRPIRFGPGLLVFLDQLKRKNFLRNWENSLVQE